MHKPQSPPRVVRLSIFALLILSGMLVFLFQQDFTPFKTKSSPQARLKAFAQLPLRFEKNMGQAGDETAFLYRDQHFALHLSPDRAVMSVQQPAQQGQSDRQAEAASVAMRLAGANPQARGDGLEKLITQSNYFIGNDPAQWRAAIPNYRKVRFAEVYPGIDLVYYGRDGKLEYDFKIAPGADPAAIALQFENAAAAKVADSGDLVVQTGSRRITMQAPVAFQEVAGARTAVAAQFVARGEHTFGFEVGEYDPALPLVIDPVLVYSTLLGAFVSNSGNDIAVDAKGYIYITGDAFGNAFVAKLHPDSSALLYKTVLGGDLEDRGLGIAVDTAGYAYITGETQSGDFPLHNALQSEFGGTLWVDGDAFISRLTPDGSAFVYSTYLGGGSEDIGHDIAVDLSGNAYVTGETNSSDFPVANALQPAMKDFWKDAFVAKVNADGSAFVFSTYLGGSNSDQGYGIAIDADRNIYITGQTISSDFPLVNAFQQGGTTGWDAFVTKMNAQGTALIFSTHLTGGSDPSSSNTDKGTAIAVNALGQVYVAGETFSPDFPTSNAIQPNYGGGLDGFVSKFTADGTALLFSTYLGGTDFESGLKIALDAEGNAFVSGQTQSTNFPTEQPIQAALNGSSDAFVTGISADGLALLFSSYLGSSQWDFGNGIAVAQNGHLYLTGKAGSADFPTVSPLAASENSTGGAFVSIIDPDLQEEVLWVKVMQDSLNREPQPVPNTRFGVYQIDLSAPQNPLTFVNFLTSDNDGLLGLPPDYFAPGDSFFLRVDLGARDAVKANHSDLDGHMLRFFSDNLHIDTRGSIHPAELSANELDTTQTYMGHTSLGYNLLVSIEWPASDDYVADLEAAFRFASNELYDVSNGQAFFQTVAVYDNKKYWDDADLRIHADNTQWPEATLSGISQGGKMDATINLPPKHYGSKTANVNEVFAEEPLYFFSRANAHTIVHEFGHYGFGFWDEYENAAGNTIDIFTNYGFMDGAPLSQDMTSEMSAFVISGYAQTAQFAKTGKTCWDFWHARFDTIPKYNFGAIYATIKTPAAMGLVSNHIVAGPNDDLWAPDFNVGAMMDFVIETSSFNAPRPVFVMQDKQTNEPAAGAKVIAVKGRKRFMQQGKTVLSGPDKGKIRPFGMQAGDKLRAGWGMSSRRYAFAEVEVTSSALAKASSAQGNEIVVELQPVQGSFTLLPEVSFASNGGLKFSAPANKAFNGSAQLEISAGAGDLQVIDLNASGTTYSATLPDGDYRNATLYFRAADSTNTAFFLPMNVSLLSNSGAELIAARDNIRLQPAAGATAEKYIVTTSPFPVPQDGLPDSLRQASALVSLHAFPENADMRTQLKITIDADTLTARETAAIVIYRWQDGWQPVATEVNLAYGIASTTVSAPGFYMAFLDLTRKVTGIEIGAVSSEPLPRGFALQQNYPNPFNPSTVISYQLSAAGVVELSIYDPLGRRIATLVHGRQTAGSHVVQWHGRDAMGKQVPSGVYLLRLQVGQSVQTRKIVLVR